MKLNYSICFKMLTVKLGPVPIELEWKIKNLILIIIIIIMILYLEMGYDNVLQCFT
jgi:hypothetical protein